MEKILVIDDEENIVKILGELLKVKGYETLTANSGREGMALFQVDRPGLVIVDVVMPGLDGIEVLYEIKHSSPETEVIMMTAYEDSDLAIKSLHFEASDFITKPINPEELYLSIKRALEKRSMKRQLAEYTKDLEKLVEDRTRRFLRAERQALIGDLVQGLLHSIQEPLSIIGTRAEFLKWKLRGLTETQVSSQDYLSSENIKQNQAKMEKNIQDIEIISKNARSITKIIENFMYKCAHEHQEKEESIDVNQVITQEMMFFDSHVFFKHRIEKTYDLDPNLEKVSMVYGDLTQIFDNLLKNAIDAMYNSPQKKLKIATFQDDGNVFIEFTDTRLPHFKGDSEYSEWKENESSAMGLGFLTCMSLIAKYGGNIEVNTHQEEGAGIRLKIPKRREGSSPSL